MAWTEELPSGKHRGVYRLPDGRKRSAGTFAHKRAALKAASAAEVESQALGWRDPKAGLRTWADWCEAWWASRSVEASTLKRDESRRDRHLLPKWGSVSLVDITRHEVKVWAADLRKGDMAPETVKRCVHLLSASLTAAVDAEILTSNAAARLSLAGGEQAKERYLTHEEVSRLLQPLDEGELDHALLSLLVGTGLRWGEAAGLQTKRLDFKRGLLLVSEVWDDKQNRVKAYPKGRKIRQVPMPGWVIDTVKPVAAESANGFVFETRGVPIDYSNWRRRVWLTAIKNAKIADVTIHDLRHTYASWLIQDGVSLERVGQLLGHVSPLTTRRYAHLAEVADQEILAALPAPVRIRGANVGQTEAPTGSQGLRLVVDNSA
jgi:integrase